MEEKKSELNNHSNMAIISVNGLNDNTIDQGRMYMVLVNIFTSIFR